MIASVNPSTIIMMIETEKNGEEVSVVVDSCCCNIDRANNSCRCRSIDGDNNVTTCIRLDIIIDVSTENLLDNDH